MVTVEIHGQQPTHERRGAGREAGGQEGTGAEGRPPMAWPACRGRPQRPETPGEAKALARSQASQTMSQPSETQFLLRRRGENPPAPPMPRFVCLLTEDLLCAGHAPPPSPPHAHTHTQPGGGGHSQDTAPALPPKTLDAGAGAGEAAPGKGPYAGHGAARRGPRGGSTYAKA